LYHSIQQTQQMYPWQIVSWLHCGNCRNIP